jgi:hypothetical protein
VLHMDWLKKQQKKLQKQNNPRIEVVLLCGNLKLLACF